MLKKNLAGITQHQENPLIDSQLFQAVFHDSPDAIFILDAGNYHILECNNKSLQLFEVGNVEDLRNLSYLKLYASEPIEINKNIINAELNEKGTYTQELSFKTLKGNIFWGRLTKRSVNISGHEVIVMRVGKIIDYLRTEEALSALLKGTSKVTGKLFLKELTRLLVRSFDTKYAFIGKTGGSKKNKIDILQIWEGTDEGSPSSYETQGSCVENVLKGYTSYYPCKMKEMFPEDEMVQSNNIESMLGTPIFDTNGNAIGILVVMDDKAMNEIPNARYILSIFAARAGAEIQRIKSKELLREQTRRLSETNHMKDRVLALIAHDLKNPLHTILGFSELLKNKSGDYSKDQLTKRIEIIDNSIKNLYCFLENLIDWSKLQRDTLKPKIEEFNIHTVIEDNIDLFQYIIHVKSIEVNNKISENKTIKGDKYYMNSIIRNLLSNAIIYNYKKGKVDISLTEDNGCITFAIADQGIGIAKEEMDDILGAGSQFKKSEASKDGGTGLGLVISKTFIEKQGGKIWFTSTANNGTTFYFTIPG